MSYIWKSSDSIPWISSGSDDSTIFKHMNYT